MIAITIVPAGNGRFCESGGVCPLELLCKFASVSPAQAFVKPPPSQSRWDVRGNAGSCAIGKRKKTEK